MNSRFEQARPGRRPPLAFALDPTLTSKVLSAAHLTRLSEICDVLDPVPLTTFDDPRAASVLPRVEVLVTGWGCANVGAEVLDRAPHLQLIAHAAGTVKSLIARAAYDRGIVVTNAADANALPVAEFTLAAILFANKRVLEFRDLYRRERSGLRTHPLQGGDVGNWRKTVGLIGLSRVGRRMMTLLEPFDFEVLVHDPYVTTAEARALGGRLVELDELFASSDVVSLHAPALESTRHMIDARLLALMRDGATFINTARGSVVDQDALVRELVSGRVFAVIDVTEPEVLPADSPLYTLPNVLLTPHIAGALGTERERLGGLVVEEIERYVSGQPLMHAVAADTLERQA